MTQPESMGETIPEDVRERKMTEAQFERFLRDYADKVADGTAKPQVAAWLMKAAADRLEAFAAIGAALLRKPTP